MKHVRLVLIIISLALVSVAGCKRQGHDLNEGLRLPQKELESYKSRALQGDAEAAKKLWHHYSFVEMDEGEGERWKGVYNKLTDAKSLAAASPTAAQSTPSTPTP